jgi:hypothetical protein
VLTHVGELPLAPVVTAPPGPGDGSGGVGYVAAVDGDGLPVGLSVPGDGAEGMPQVAVLPAALGIEELLGTGVVPLLRLNPYGALVVDGAGVVLGVLERATVDALLHTYGVMEAEVRGEAPKPEEASLAGRVSTPLAKVTCRCGRPMVLSAYDPEYPPSCPGTGDGRGANAHPLELTWR